MSLLCTGGSGEQDERQVRMSYLGEEIKKLGFGFMRLPMIEGKEDEIDIEQTKEMVDLFMEAGFTYFDTAWAYKGSEEALRQSLVERYPRDSFQVATKMAAWLETEDAEQAKAQFDTSLERSGAGFFDYYLLHNLGGERTKTIDEYGLWDWTQEKKAKGEIKHAGFSFHSTAEELDKILTDHPEMEFVQLQINYADWDSPTVQSGACYEVARRHGVPVIVMEPVKGGMLATPPQDVVDLFKAAEPQSSVASWAVRFAADLEGIITVLSGMSNVEQMKDNLSYMKDFKCLSDEQKAVIHKAQTVIKEYPVIPCTSCEYCGKVCPEEVGISGSFESMNLLILYRNLKSALDKEKWAVINRGKKRANKCIKCGKCEEVCPQHIAIRDELEKISETFGME